MVEKHHLRSLRRWGQERLQPRMVKARPAVQAQQHRTLAHHCAVGDEPHPRHVEIQPDITDPDAHAADPTPTAARGRNPRPRRPIAVGSEAGDRLGCLNFNLRAFST